ncbi:WD40 repeat-like protein, partial [Aureobasidium melanogenum]
MASDLGPKAQLNAPTESRSGLRHEIEGLCHHDHEHESHKFRHHDNTNDENISIPSNSKHAEQAIAPFLAKHIPTQYNPVGHLIPQSTSTDLNHDHHQDPSSTKFCYRHRPDLKCRRQANEPSMEQLQNVSHNPVSGNDSLYANFRVGTRHRFAIRPASHLPCLVPLLRRPFQTPQ